MTKAGDYYDSATLDQSGEHGGTGFIHVMTEDQLRPPMVDSDEVWANGALWPEAARDCVRRLTRSAQYQPKDLVVDAGCGIGGPARVVAKDFGVRVHGLNVSEEQIASARRITERVGLNDLIRYQLHDVRNPLPVQPGSLDGVMTYNMWYHVDAKQQTLNQWGDAIKSGGRLAFDDWVLTDTATDADQDTVRFHWPGAPLWTTTSELEAMIAHAGFTVDDVQSFAHVGRGPMARHFRTTFDRDFRNKVNAYDPEHEKLADHFVDAIEDTIAMYQRGTMDYVQIVATKK